MKRIFRLFVLLFAVIVSSAIVCFGAVGQSGNLKSEATVQNELLVPMQIAATTAETIESNQDTFEYTWPSVMAAAEAGNPKAMCLVANHYCWGEGVCDDFRGGKNYKKALEWYRRAAALNHTEAMRKLGDMYSAGKGVIGSDREARKWYEMASKNGDTDAMIALGDSYKYALNKDVAEDRNKALEWYLEAARRGEKKANFSVGLMLHYMSGDGNKEESYIWLARAALGGSSTAQKLLVDNGIHSNQFKEYAARKTRIDDGTYTSASASSATSSKAAATSKANTETASTTPQSLTPQQCYAKGNALYEQRKYEEAIPWLERAAEAKIRSAYMPLAKCYHIEGHSKSNPKKAWTYYAHCVGGDNPHSRDYWYASFMLGQMFTTGYGCEKNYDSALFFLREFRKYTTPENYDTADKLINEVLALQRGATMQSPTGASSNRQQTTAHASSTNRTTSSTAVTSAKQPVASSPKPAQPTAKPTQSVEKAPASTVTAQASSSLSLKEFSQYQIDGLDAYAGRNYVEAQRCFTIVVAELDKLPSDAFALRLHKNAYSVLGLIYFMGGHGVTQNYDKAFKLFKKAAALEDAMGQFYLGCCYYSGRGVEEDVSRGLTYWVLAARQDHEQAQEMLTKIGLDWRE